MSSARSVDLSDDRTSSVVSAAVASMVLCIVFYAFRIASHFISRTSLIVSDYVLFGGVIACFVISCIDLWVLRLGLGRHVELVAERDPKLNDIRTMLKFLMVNDCVYAFGQVTVKISLLLLYRQLFLSKKLHLLIKVTGWFMIAWGIAFVGVAIFSCNPIHAFWDFDLQATSYCINNQAWYIAMAIPTILTDILILCMPIQQVWKLQFSQRDKLALTIIFALGSFVCVIGIIRVTALFQIDNADPSYTLVGIANWSSVEFAMAVICASMPTLRPIIVRFRACFPSPGHVRAEDIGGNQFQEIDRPRKRLKGPYSLPTIGNECYAAYDASDDHGPARSERQGEQHILVTNTFKTGEPC